MKTMENEMKEEKEAERQVCSHVLSWVDSCGDTDTRRREEYRRSRTSVPQRRRRSAMKRWPRRCTRSALRG